MTTTLEVAEQLADELYGLHCDIGRLEVENAKLRELLSEVYEDQCDESDRWKYCDRMRELKVEVSE